MGESCAVGVGDAFGAATSLSTAGEMLGLGKALGCDSCGIARPRSPRRMSRPTPRSTTAARALANPTAPIRSSACLTTKSNEDGKASKRVAGRISCASPMKTTLARVGLIAILFALVSGSAAAATTVTARTQLRGHLPELGERPTMRVFVTQSEYDTYRNSLGDANVFPAASSLFMSFEKDILALYTRGNDTGGRCIGTQIVASFSGDTLSANATWQAGTCRAPSSAHYPFVLVSFSRTAADGTAWLPTARSVCLSVESQDTNACATLAGASPAPSPA